MIRIEEARYQIIYEDVCMGIGFGYSLHSLFNLFWIKNYLWRLYNNHAQRHRKKNLEDGRREGDKQSGSRDIERDRVGCLKG